MSDKRKLDLSDPMVRDMADRNHEPDELWVRSGRLLSMLCRTCGQSWPCETRRAVDAWRDWHRPRSIFEPRLIAGSPPDPNPWPRAGRFWLFRGWKR